MNRDDIIRMAREAGLLDGPVFAQGLERFAALVAAAERERNTKEFPVQFGSVKAWEDWCKSIRDNEREACAKVCEENADDDSEGEWDSACINCAYHIRARG